MTVDIDGNGKSIAHVSHAPDTPVAPGPTLREWNENAKHLLDSYPKSVRSCYKGGPENLMESMCITFIGMREALKSAATLPAAPAPTEQAGGLLTRDAIDGINWLNDSMPLSDDVPQPIAGTIVLLETFARLGMTAKSDGKPTPNSFLCLRFAAELRALAAQQAPRESKAEQAALPRDFLMPEDAWSEYATRSGLLNEHGVAPHPATAQAAYFAYQAAWNCLHKAFSAYIAARQAPTEAPKDRGDVPVLSAVRHAIYGLNEYRAGRALSFPNGAIGIIERFVDARQAPDSRDAERYRFRHSNYVDQQGYEYGYAKIKWSTSFGGAPESVLWATDAEIDSAMAAAIAQEKAQ